MYICFFKQIIMSEKATIIVHFPVKPHVYKYLQKKCGEKLVVSQGDFFGGLVLDLLSRKPCSLQGVSDEFTFPVEISMRYLREVGIFFDDKIIRKFNNRVDDMFRQEIYSFVLMNYDLYNTPKERSLKHLLNHYSITEDDIKFESLVKDYKRKLKPAVQK